MHPFGCSCKDCEAARFQVPTKFVPDFGGQVDGGGVKGSMTDPGKPPLHLIPSAFYLATIYWREGSSGSRTQDVVRQDTIIHLTRWNDRRVDRLGTIITKCLIDFAGSPEALLAGVAAVLRYGAKKYAAHNWRRGMAWSEVYSAAMRHLTLADPTALDPESGEPHWAHLACCIAFLMEYEGAQGEVNPYAQFDDRYQPIVIESKMVLASLARDHSR